MNSKSSTTGIQQKLTARQNSLATHASRLSNLFDQLHDKGMSWESYNIPGIKATWNYIQRLVKENAYESAIEIIKSELSDENSKWDRDAKKMFIELYKAASMKNQNEKIDHSSLSDFIRELLDNEKEVLSILDKSRNVAREPPSSTTVNVDNSEKNPLSPTSNSNLSSPSSSRRR